MKRREFLKKLMTAAVISSLPWENIALAIEPVAPQLSRDINLTFAEIVENTLLKNKALLADNVSKNNELLKRIKNAT